MGGLNMDHGLIVKEVHELVNKLCLLPEYESDQDFRILCVKLQHELNVRDFLSAVCNMSSEISMYLMLHKYQAPSELLKLQRKISKLSTKQNGLRYLSSLFGMFGR